MREACALYKQALDKYLPPEYSRVVYSPSKSDSETLKQYHLSEAQEKQVRKVFASKCVVWVRLQPSAEALTFIESRPNDFIYDETKGTLIVTGYFSEDDRQTFLLSIGDRAETIAQAYENRQIDTQVALSDFEKLAQEYIDANAEQQQLDVDENTYAIHTVLKLAVEDLTVDQAREINVIFTRFPDYQWNEQQKSELRKELYKVVRPLVGASRMINVTNTLLKLQRV